MTILRDMLKSGTAISHDRIDRRMGSLDLTTSSGLGRFLSVHYLVQSLLDPLLSDTPSPAFLPELRHDLKRLGYDLPDWVVPPDPNPFHACAYRYVLTGSQLGARLLYRNWSDATDPVILAAGTYLTANTQSRAWPIFLSDLNELNLGQDEMVEIVASANRVFELFGLAATQFAIETGP